MTGRSPLTDDQLQRALAPYREVEASRRLRQGVVDPVARPARPPSRRPVLVGCAFAGLALIALAITMVVSDGPRAVDRQVASPPVDISDVQEVVFADGLTVDTDELFDAANHDRLRVLFRDHGAELIVREVPVNPAADGRVFTVTVPRGGGEMLSPGVYRIGPGARIEVEVGRSDAAAGTEGLTLFEVFPEVEEAVVRDDPAATGAALEALGFDVRWVLIERAGVGHDVEEPPPGTVVLSVLGPNGEWTSIEAGTRTLMVEVATPAVATDLGH